MTVVKLTKKHELNEIEKNKESRGEIFTHTGLPPVLGP